MRWRRPRKIFVSSLSDLFHDEVPTDYLTKAWAVMAACPDHTFQVLTKWPVRMRSVLARPNFRDEVAEEITELMRRARPPGRCWPVTLDRITGDGWKVWGPSSWPLPWAWTGVTAENQYWLEARLLRAARSPRVGPAPLTPRGVSTWFTVGRGSPRS